MATRQQPEANLIEQYRSFSERLLSIENVEFLDRGASKQPITIVHHRNLTSSNRVLVIAVDDNVRVLATGIEDAVIVGSSMADRIRDLTPPTFDTAAKGAPQWKYVHITDPNSDRMIRFLKDELLPYAEGNYAPFLYKV